MGSDKLRQARDNKDVLVESIKRQVEEAFELGYDAGVIDGYNDGVEDGRRWEAFDPTQDHKH